jgi:hypothetical protein
MIRTQAHIDDDTITVHRQQDVEPALEDAKARHNAGLFGSSDYKHAAELPFVLIENYCEQHGITFREWMANPEHVKRMCNDVSLSGFRIWPGRL